MDVKYTIFAAFSESRLSIFHPSYMIPAISSLPFYMRNLLFFGICFLVHNLCAMEEITNFGDNPGKLRMYLYVPSDAKGPMPLVVALHGCSQNAEELAEISGWNELADRYGFAVLYPEQRSGNNMTTCFNWFLPNDSEGDGGELASIRSMMDYAAQLIAIDGERIFTYGLSAGAAMANSLLANDPAGFAGGAIFAGGAHGSATNAWQGMQVMMNPENLSPEEWKRRIPGKLEKGNLPKVIIVQGTKDYVVDPRNAQELIDQWSAAHGTDNVENGVDEAYTGNQSIQRLYYSSEFEQEAVVFYSIIGLGHQLAVDPGTGARQGGQTGAFAVDLDFYSTWYIAKDFGLIGEE